jgi:hypothetical protein
MLAAMASRRWATRVKVWQFIKNSGRGQWKLALVDDRDEVRSSDSVISDPQAHRYVVPGDGRI